MPRTHPEVTTLQQALDAGLLDRMHYVNEQLGTQAERVDYLRSVYPGVSTSTMRAMIDLASRQESITHAWNLTNEVPANRDIPILTSLPYGTRSYRVWVRVTVTFNAEAGGDYPAGTRSTIFAVDQTGHLDLRGATFDAQDPAISRIMGQDTVPAGAHGDVFSEISFEIVAIGRSNFGRP